jgi:hypothetical protein
MKKQVLLLTITTLLLIAVMMIPVSAQTIQIASPNSISQQDVMVYWFNGTFYGRYNTTSLITLPNMQPRWTIRSRGYSPPSRMLELMQHRW